LFWKSSGFVRREFLEKGELEKLRTALLNSIKDLGPKKLPSYEKNLDFISKHSNPLITGRRSVPPRELMGLTTQKEANHGDFHSETKQVRPLA